MNSNSQQGANILSFLAGIAVGVGAAVYFSNEQNRKNIMDKYNDVKGALADKASEVQNRAADVMDQAQNTMNDKAENMKSNLRENSGRNQGGNNRR